ncbi:MAG TPA: histidine kinase [Kofleriaceae bacterium]|nr:histidine kinase [Kofleriaceae bacterium]
MTNRAAGAAADATLAAGLLDRGVADLVWLVVAVIVFDRASRAMPGVGVARVAGRFAVLGLVLAPLYLCWGPLAYAMVHGTGLSALPDALRRVPATTVIWDVFLYAILALAANVLFVSRRALRHERAGADLKARLAHAELELLRAQLEPHFLFNALNTIAGLIRGSRAALATTALAKLSELLRYVIEASRQDRVPLAWELEFATNYLELQQMRFGPRLRFVIHEAALGRGCEVPPLLLQPLIENAVVHGVACTSQPVTIEVRIATTAGELRIEIANTRDANAVPDGETTGVGLSNTRQRLERMYGTDFVFDAGLDGPDRYRVAIALPRAAVVA